jgi:hypothetical protein
MHSIPDLVFSRTLLPNTRGGALFHAIYDVREEKAVCVAPASLAVKYGVEERNSQSVVTVQNRFTRQRTFWNAQRTAKPQSFVAAGKADDPTSGRICDFCSFQTLTATDTWGRVENEHCVTASNLFKITRNHGLVLFKHHEPLEFSLEQLSSLLVAAQQWVHNTHAACPEALHPLLMWNSGPRSGASQYHGHAQVMLTDAALPDIERRLAAAVAFAAQGDDATIMAPAEDGAMPMAAVCSPGAAFEQACAEAHAALGLRRVLRLPGAAGRGDDVAWVYHETQPLKDMDTVVIGTAIDSPAFIALMHCALRTLIDRCGVLTFNVSVTGFTLAPPPAGGAQQPQPVELGRVVARLVSRGKVTSAASDYGALEVFTGSSIGHTSPWRLAAELDAEAHSRGWTLHAGEGCVFD